jgi:hypothetical protein
VRSRDGFLLATVLLVAAVAGAVVLLIHQHMLHRSVQVAQSTDRAAARTLARGALDVMKFALREACLPPPPGVAVTSTAKDLFALVLQDVAAIQKECADGREFLDRRLGAKALEPLDRLVAKLPSASVDLTVSVQAPSPSTSTPLLFRDPVRKMLQVTIGARARVRFAEDALHVVERWQVYSQLPLAGKFTLAVRSSEGVASQKLHDDGRPFGDSSAPVVLIHHPKDGDPMAANPFATGAEKPLVEGSVAASAVVTQHAERGLALIGPPEGQAASYLPVAMGGAPYGELSSLFRPEGGRPSLPFAKPIADQPPLLRAFAPTDPVPPNVTQAAWIQGTLLGFSVKLDPSLLDTASDGSAASYLASRLKLFGTGAMPSPGAVIGPVWRLVAAVSSIAIDRDATDQDEADQAAAVGRPLPQRDAREPFLVSADEEQYKTDLAAEASAAEPAYARLRPFGTGGNHGNVTNENYEVDLDGDGEYQTVASETLHRNLQLDLTQWKYGNLFANYEDYKRVMSRHLALPANMSLSLAGAPADQALDVLRQAAFGKAGLLSSEDWVVTSLHLTHRGALHREPAFKAGGPVYVSSGRMSVPDLFDSIDFSTAVQSAHRPTIRVRGQRRFEELFMPGSVLDLGGANVEVVPVEGEPPGLTFDRPLAVRPGSGGVLRAVSLACPGILNPGEPETFAPICVRVGELVMTGKGPYEAVLRPQHVRIETDVEHVVIKGSLVVDTIPDALPVPLVVAWDPRLDPTGEATPSHYRVSHERQRKVYQAGLPLK